MTDWTSKFSRRGAALKPSAIRQTAKYAAQPGVISFASGSPNPDLFPYDALNAAMTGLMADPKRRGEALQYGSSEGYKPLRELIAERARRDGARVAADNIVITNGSQQTLEFMAKLLVEPGDLVAVTSPTYLGAMQAFDLFQPNYADVTLNDDGVNLAALERAFAAGARFFYLTPDFGNPSGVTLPVEQRRAILKLARKHQTPIFEDQAYEHLWFGAEKLPSMLALDSEDGDPSLVIHAGTFSKSLAPGVRVGWIVAPKPMAEKLALMRQASDLQGASLNQMIVHDAAVAILDDHIVELTENIFAKHEFLHALTRICRRKQFRQITARKLRVRIDQRYPLTEAAQAHRDLEARKTTGSSVLLP